jgi:hypothetical protein
MNDWLDKSLQDLAAEDPPAEAVAEVRMRVMERVQTRRRGWLWWLVPAAAVAAAVVWFSVPVARVPVAAPRTEMAQATKPLPALPPAQVAAEPVPPAVHQMKRPQTQVARPVTPDEQAPVLSVRETTNRAARVEMAQAGRMKIMPTGTPDFVRIESGNPNVVILWSLNQPVTDLSGDKQ